MGDESSLETERVIVYGLPLDLVVLELVELIEYVELVRARLRFEEEQLIFDMFGFCVNFISVLFEVRDVKLDLLATGTAIRAVGRLMRDDANDMEETRKDFSSFLLELFSNRL